MADIQSSTQLAHGQITIPTNVRFQNLTGQRFGRLVITEYAGRNGTATQWKCTCDCGNTIVALAGNIKKGDTRSCGCLRREVSAARLTTHGMRDTAEFRIWAKIIERCENPKSQAYKYYGGRGISICERWRHSFVEFFQDMGPRPSPEHQIDRYPDMNGNYEPGNCRWATPTQNNRNRRSNHVLAFQGRSQTIADWGDEIGIPGPIITNRLLRGWSVADALTRSMRKVRKWKYGPK